MTTVYFDKENLIFTAKGHANFSKNGEPDIVCSAVSTLCFTLAQNLINTDSFMYCAPPVISLESGDVKIVYYAKKKYYNEINKIFEFAFSGFLMLEQKYPDNVRIKGDMK